MSWQACLDEGRAKKVSPDLERAHSVRAMSERKFRWLAIQKMDAETASPILANYFDALSELCDSMLLARGLRVSAAARDCVTCFIADVLKEGTLAEIFDRYRLIRNRINYYGKIVTLDTASEGVKEILEVFTKLKSKYAKF